MPVIELTGVSKRYRRHTGRPRATTFMSYVLRDVWKRQRVETAPVWALRDITLKIDKGMTVGMIGRNGSGKSTLIKLLSRIHKPDTGCVTVRGTVAALIELGAGFHPELTGRENVLVNGIILGLTREQVKARFNDIVEFAELADCIDEPVRTYSSGMYLRLGFAIAAHVDPDILLLDEVLAVGDEAFSRKCIERMNRFKDAGKTIILVSHALDLVRTWCDRVVWLHEGILKLDGSPEEVVRAYSQGS